jgi:hypothetical protein
MPAVGISVKQTGSVFWSQWLQKPVAGVVPTAGGNTEGSSRGPLGRNPPQHFAERVRRLWASATGLTDVAQMIFEEPDPFAQSVEAERPAEPEHGNCVCRCRTSGKHSRFVAHVFGKT